MTTLVIVLALIAFIVGIFRPSWRRIGSMASLGLALLTLWFMLKAGVIRVG